MSQQGSQLIQYGGTGYNGAGSSCSSGCAPSSSGGGTVTLLTPSQQASGNNGYTGSGSITGTNGLHGGGT